MEEKEKPNGVEKSAYTAPRGILKLVAETALGESNVNGRGSGIERKIQESAGEGRLQIDD
jgi:hypothetical protein